MKEQWFTAELLENVVVSAHAATEGGHRCLDYLPGSVFLGVAAARLFKSYGASLFLSGRVRFGTGLPLTESGKLALPVPLSYHLFKGMRPGESMLHNGLDEATVSYQIEQMREGAVTADGEFMRVRKGRTQKSATDRDLFGSAREDHLFDYEYLKRGQKFALRLCADGDVEQEAFDAIVTVLSCPAGIRIGRSRSAEFSDIKLTANESPYPIPLHANPDGNRCFFYLVSDLALYRNGSPTLQPRPKDFDLPGGTFLPEQSFLRTRRYSPWNAFHRLPDLERQVLVRGSVITFEVPNGLTADDLEKIRTTLNNGLEAYRQDGLGWVLMNPAFVVAPAKRLIDKEEKAREKAETIRRRALAATTAPDSPLLRLVARRHDKAVVEEMSLSLGLKWADTL